MADAGNATKLTTLDLANITPQDAPNIQKYFASTRRNMISAQRAIGKKDNPCNFVEMLWLWTPGADKYSPNPKPKFQIPESWTDFKNKFQGKNLVQDTYVENFKVEVNSDVTKNTYEWQISGTETLSGEEARKEFQRALGGPIGELQSVTDFFGESFRGYMVDAMEKGFILMSGIINPQFQRQFLRGDIKSWDQLQSLYYGYTNFPEITY